MSGRFQTTNTQESFTGFSFQDKLMVAYLAGPAEAYKTGHQQLSFQPAQTTVVGWKWEACVCLQFCSKSAALVTANLDTTQEQKARWLRGAGPAADEPCAHLFFFFFLKMYEPTFCCMNASGSQQRWWRELYKSETNLRSAASGLLR